MRNSLIALFALVTVVLAQGEPFRPQFHFTPGKNWMNDPNGMVFYEGEWHLFYQYNPHGNTWGHMSWGHAVSRDLVRWEHLPLALAEENDVMIFSGSAVVDWKNSSGFGKDGQPPLVAIYTAHTPTNQSQHIAYSTDKGRTWTKFAGNYGAGIEYRFSRVGFRVEGRDYVYKFDRYGFDKTQHDIAWQGGVTVSF